ncbi:hypothetical protein Ssi03_21860 [Sphaerisporangium siamense]|uniref:GT2 family glycosyltransferase n=1 Tax=Sphaerisporangium siamense TaxID=795645 RepID=A0A7W7D8C5_9ACTN|nr:glycosyltransferase family 2 protein [Sphaerisporangium siamense]MBB4701896.1 GT2 family glycosyltransferase [Sphaerisporangium siamense]GII84196.1 hypothetical protein Ssi03_21860 [Sphaerisporangium siamense]
MSVSVVIPTRDKALRLRLTLACLADTEPAGYLTEVVVVDDGSVDATAEVLAEAAERLPLRVVAGGGRGRAGARNLGAEHAGGDLLVFLDDDVLVGPGFVGGHRARSRPDRFVHGRLRELPAADHLVRTLDGAPYPEVREARDLIHGGRSSHPRHRLKANALERAIEAMHGGDLPDAVPWLGCVGANVSMPRALWERVGGFDAGFGEVWGCEDLELGLRLYEAGARRDLAPDALGVHLTHRRPSRWDEHATNMNRFAALHPVPAVRELPYLLSASGDPSTYITRVLTAARLTTPPAPTVPSAPPAGSHLAGPPVAGSASAPAGPPPPSLTTGPAPTVPVLADPAAASAPTGPTSTAAPHHSGPHPVAPAAGPAPDAS